MRRVSRRIPSHQPSLLDALTSKPEPVPVRKRPAQDAPSEEAPWWQRARKVAESGVLKASEPQGTRQVAGWGARWRQAMREAGWLETLAPGQSAVYVRMVRALDVRDGVLEATVVPAQSRPHRVQVRVPAFTASEWARLARQVVDDGAVEAVTEALAQGGQPPMALVEAADRHQLRLLPRKLAQLAVACTCGGAKAPCGHVLALHLAFAKRLETDALSLLTVRGATPDALAALLSRVSGEVQLLAKQDGGSFAHADPLAAPDLPEPAWEKLDGPMPARAPLPALEGWRGRETFDAMVLRLLEDARERLDS